MSVTHRPRHLAAMVAVLGTLTGCCCAVPRTVVSQPDVTFTLSDPAGAPLVGCQVALHRWSDPHHMWESTVVETTDATGTVVFSEQTEREVILPLMMHGVPWYSFSWGVECPGHTSLIGTFQLVESGDSFQLLLAMTPGTSAPVDDFDTFPTSAATTWTSSSDGKQHGPVEAQPATP